MDEQDTAVLSSYDFCPGLILHTNKFWSIFHVRNVVFQNFQTPTITID